MSANERSLRERLRDRLAQATTGGPAPADSDDSQVNDREIRELMDRPEVRGQSSSSSRPTGVAGPDQTPEPAPDDSGGGGGSDIPRRRGGTTGGRSGRDEPRRDRGGGQPTGPTGPDQTPEPAPPDGRGDDRPTGPTGPGETPEPAPPDGRGGDQPTGPTGPDQTPEPEPDPAPSDGRGGGRPTGPTGPDETPDPVAQEREAQAEELAAAVAADIAPAARAVAADPGRDRTVRPIAGGRQAARAVSRTPRGTVDPVAEVAAVSDVLEEASATTRPAAPEFGADVEGFDEVGSGAFDLPGAPGQAQERAQREADEILSPTDAVAREAEGVRRDILDLAPDLGGDGPFDLGFGGGTAGGLAAAGAAGVVTPEPVTSVGGAALLGGLALTGIAFDVARREGLVELPEDGSFLPAQEQPAEGEDVVTQTTLELPEADSLSGELPVTGGDVFGPEVSVPEESVGVGEGIGIPELAASQFAQQQRQRQREERERDDVGIFDRRGADEDELDEILRGPSEDVVLGEETPPAEEVAEETSSDFVFERDIDPRVVEPEQLEDVWSEIDLTGAEEPSATTETATRPSVELSPIAALEERQATAQQPSLTLGEQQTPDVAERELQVPAAALDVAEVQAPGLDVGPSFASPEATAEPLLGEDLAFAQPTAPGLGEGLGFVGPRGGRQRRRDTGGDLLAFDDDGDGFFGDTGTTTASLVPSFLAETAGFGLEPRTAPDQDLLGDLTLEFGPGGLPTAELLDEGDGDPLSLGGGFDGRL